MAKLSRLLRTTIVTVLLSVVSALPASAQPQPQATKRPMTLMDLAELRRIGVGTTQLSPDGRTLVYILSTTDWKTGRSIYHLWKQNVGGGAPTQLTFTETGDIPAGVRWSPDGRTLLFLRDGQIWLLPADGGEPRALTKHATNVSQPAWTPDGATVYFLASDPPTADERERTRLRDDVRAFEEDYKQRRLWKIVVSTGAETQLTSGDFTVMEYRLSTDGKRMAMQRAPSPLSGDAYRGEVWVMDANAENARVLTSNAIEEFGLELSPDNSQILFRGDAGDQFEPTYNTNLWVVPAAGGTPRAVLPDFDYSIEWATWSPDGRSIYLTANMGVHSEFFQVDVVARRARQMTDGEHYIPPGWSMHAGTGAVVFQVDEPTRFGDVWTLPLSAGTATKAVRITGAFDALERDFALPRQQKVVWKGADGVNVEGVLIYPLDYRQGQRYPLVVQLHGGPQESDKFGAGPGLLQSYVPVLAAKGYAVLRPNFRGSNGYGSAFLRDVVNGYFHNMAPDVMLGIDALVQQGVVDPNRLAVMGWSAGATLVNKLITQTDRFKVASVGAGISNWISLFAQSDNTSFRRTWFGGMPWGKTPGFDAFWASSPIKDVANVKTPTLFFGGEADTRVPLSQSLEMYRGLKSNGIPTHLYVAPREPHNWGEQRHLLFKANTELEWFEKYLNGRAYVWEKAPSS